MNPYETPKSKSSDLTNVLRPGQICNACGSTNTTSDDVLRPKPSILMVILFGWLFLLIRGAFAMKTDRCHDCDATHRYKSTGSWIALVILIFLVICVAAAVLNPE